MPKSNSSSTQQLGRTNSLQRLENSSRPDRSAHKPSNGKAKKRKASNKEESKVANGLVVEYTEQDGMLMGRIKKDDSRGRLTKAQKEQIEKQEKKINYENNKQLDTFFKA